jgi:succinoglycan biosynthesis protein ExoO
MPCYNSADTLSLAAASVLDQSLTSIELIIVDDASTDGTWKIAERLARGDNRVRRLRHSRNGGQSAARNIALDAARGVWIAPVDADDEISRDRLRTLYEAGEAGAADFIADGVRFVGSKGRGTPRELSVANPAGGAAPPLSLEALISSDIPLNGHCSLGYLKPLMRRSFLDRCQLRYDEDLRFAEDFHLYVMALMYDARFLLHPESFYCYNQTPVSATRFADALPHLARYALLSNERLQAIDSARLAPSLGSLLSVHQLRWLTVLWFNLLKSAIRARQPRESLRLLRNRPGGMANVAGFVRDRILARNARSSAGRDTRQFETTDRELGYRR